MKREWGLTNEPGAVAKPGHPCAGHKNTGTLVPGYEVDPLEIWNEAESSGLRIVKVERDPHSTIPEEQGFMPVKIIAVKD